VTRTPCCTPVATRRSGWRGEICALESELADNRKKLDAVVKACAPKLVDLPGVGAVVAASILIAWSHPGRVRSEGAFASLAGTCPIPASSGNTMRHRLNRGGDRRWSSG
jgi:transposase